MMTEVLVAPDRSGERSQRDWCQVARDPVVAGAVAGTDTPPVDSDIVARVLGGTRVWVRGAPIARWGTSRGLMIFRYLLLQDRPVPRDRLMGLLWPGSTPASARNNLNVAIYGLRRALEAGAPGPHVVFRDGAYQIAPDRSLWLDVRMFVDACARGARALRDGRANRAERVLRDAVTLYGGPLFADDTDGEWYLADRRMLVERHATALHDLASLRLDVGDAAECVELGRQVLRVEPCREVTHRLLMRAYARQDLHHLAVRQYRECVDTLDRVLDVRPHPDTTRTLDDILDHA
ncbi:MAG TPA: BTAD domain-containing putative transcriptional regulator [Euzebyales bacterium]